MPITYPPEMLPIADGPAEVVVYDADDVPYVVAVSAEPRVCPSCDEEIEIGDDIVETMDGTVCVMCFLAQARE